MDDRGYEDFKYKKGVIKRDGISLAEAQKKAEWSRIVNYNLQKSVGRKRERAGEHNGSPKLLSRFL